jgi:hypothetical protein
MLDAPSCVTRVLYSGAAIRVECLADRFAELCFDRREGSVNKFDHQTVAELMDAIGVLERLPDLRGVLVTSGKPDSIVGADIREFGATFALPFTPLVRSAQVCRLEWLAASRSPERNIHTPRAGLAADTGDAAYGARGITVLSGGLTGAGRHTHLTERHHAD